MASSLSVPRQPEPTYNQVTTTRAEESSDVQKNEKKHYYTIVEAKL